MGQAAGGLPVAEELGVRIGMGQVERPRPTTAILLGGLLLLAAMSWPLDGDNRSAASESKQARKSSAKSKKKSSNAKPAPTFVANPFCRACHLDLDEEELALDSRAGRDRLRAMPRRVAPPPLGRGERHAAGADVPEGTDQSDLHDVPSQAGHQPRQGSPAHPRGGSERFPGRLPQAGMRRSTAPIATGRSTGCRTAPPDGTRRPAS